MRVWTKKNEIGSGNIKSLLFKMATDEFISHIRKKKVEKEYTDSIDIRLTQEPDTDDDLSDKKQRFEKALNQLPEKQKITLMMNKMQGLTHKEIAEILNLSQKAIEKRIRLALETLKQNLNHV
jgi:RNA polymerase sigma-70 factor (ECF subfamily)